MNRSEWKKYWIREFSMKSERLWFGAIVWPVLAAMMLVEAWSSPERRGAAVLLSLVFLGLGVANVALVRWVSRVKKVERAEPVVHRVEVLRDRPDFYAECSCGWAGDDRKTSAEAFHDARKHGGTIATKVTVLDDPESATVYEIDPAEADDKHEVQVYWDHRTFSPSCSCGWEGRETEDRPAALAEAAAHSGNDDVEVVDIGEPRRPDGAPGPHDPC
jgi:hypothetical protein